MHMSGLSGLEPHGLVHLYVGGGKGKTTAAAGLAARALGAGKSVLYCQFLKGRESGEIKSLKTLGAVIMRAECGHKFMFQMDEAEKALLARNHADCFFEAARRIIDGEFDLAVLDEVIDAAGAGLIPEAELLSLIARRSLATELVLTGRNPSPAIEEKADYYTDFICKKHPYNSGVPARKGIEY